MCGDLEDVGLESRTSELKRVFKIQPKTIKYIIS